MNELNAKKGKMLQKAKKKRKKAMTYSNWHFVKHFFLDFNYDKGKGTIIKQHNSPGNYNV